jgi:hypothetical protein
MAVADLLPPDAVALGIGPKDDAEATAASTAVPSVGANNAANSPSRPSGEIGLPVGRDDRVVRSNNGAEAEAWQGFSTVPTFWLR